MKTESTATIRINEKTHRLLKGLAGLNGVTLSEMVARLTEFWTAENPDSEDCRLCRKFGHEPNEETIKAIEELEKPGKSVPGDAYLKRLAKEIRDA